jgi:transposase InsO family protein
MSISVENGRLSASRRRRHGVRPHRSHTLELAILDDISWFNHDRVHGALGAIHPSSSRRSPLDGASDH